MAGYRDDKSKIPTEAELEAMLDAESDEEFGQSEVEVASVDQRAVLKEWTAQDFANIYTRFRPHLERHARRFLRNPSQVDEVVQDAFLYLMVTLPELDSELGVLRFLKWKVRLLCLDVIRASGKAYLADIDEHSSSLKSEEPELGSDLERAEDAAIVRMALAKLQPRHREVLIASIYEEKSTLEIAGQVGLTENATRQLMLRARNALKKALVGEVNTQGMSVSQILSVAARKAAHDAKQAGVQAMSVLAIAVLGITAFFSFGNASQVQVADPAPTNSSQPEATTDPAENFVEEPTAEVVEEQADSIPAETAVEVATFLLADPAIDQSPFNPWVVDSLLDEPVTANILLSAPEDSDIFIRLEYAAVSETGFWADFSFDADSSAPFADVRIGFVAEGQQYFAFPSRLDYYVGKLSSGLDLYTYVGKIGDIQDLSGQVYGNTRMTDVKVMLEVVVDTASGKVLNTALLAQSAS